MFLALFVFLTCSVKNQTIKEDKPVPDNTIQSIPQKQAFYFISGQHSEGDVWLYDIVANSFWQITYLNNANIEIINVSPDRAYVIIQDENHDAFVIHSDAREYFPIKRYPDEKKLKLIRNICWISNHAFLCVASDEEKGDTVFKVSLLDDEWYSYEFEPFGVLNISKPESMILSADRKYLGFLATDISHNNILSLYRMDKNDINQLSFVNGTNIHLIFNEQNNGLFYNENKTLYKIDFNKYTKILLIGPETIVNLYQNPKFKYLIYYTIKGDNNFTLLYEKNTDTIGPGTYLHSFSGIRDIYFFEDGKTLYYDTFKNELHSFDLKTHEDRLIFNDCALFSLFKK